MLWAYKIIAKAPSHRLSEADFTIGEIGNGTIICRDSKREEPIESDKITEEIVRKAQEAGAKAFRRYRRALICLSKTREAGAEAFWRYRRPEMVLTVLIAPYQMWWDLSCGAIEDAYETEDGVRFVRAPRHIGRRWR